VFGAGPAQKVRQEIAGPKVVALRFGMDRPELEDILGDEDPALFRKVGGVGGIVLQRDVSRGRAVQDPRSRGMSLQGLWCAAPTEWCRGKASGVLEKPSPIQHDSRSVAGFEPAGEPTHCVKGSGQLGWALMKLPNGDRAVVDIRKLQEYCLNPYHFRGRNKARVFASVGIAMSDAETLRSALLAAAVNAEARLGIANVYGQRYIVDFDLVRGGKNVSIRSTWIVRNGEGHPRLTSCYVI